jgi:hypothetical protein
MPRSFDLVAESPASVELIHAAFGDEQYWLARLAAFGGVTTLDTLIVDADGTVTVATTQDLRHQRLPAVVAKFIPGALKLQRKETWRPIGGRQLRGEVNFSVPGDLGSGLGQALLAPVGNGSRLSFAATVEVKVPLVAGKIESYIAGQLAEQIPQMHRFTTTWIAQHPCH